MTYTELFYLVALPIASLEHARPARHHLRRPLFIANTQVEMMSQSLWPRCDRHFVGITRHDALS